MSVLFKPTNYKSVLSIYETQVAIGIVKKLLKMRFL